MNSYRNPAAHWVPADPHNFEVDRRGHTPTPPFYIVMHTTVTTLAGAIATFQSPTRIASAHYIVGLDGSLTQMVDEKDTAFHAGDFDINLNSIGIEHEDGGRYNDPRPVALKQASARLIADLCTRYSLPCDRSVIRLHKEVSDSPTACPDALEVDQIIALAQALLKGGTPMQPIPANWHPIDIGGAWKQITEVTEGIDKSGNRVLRAVGIGTDDSAYFLQIAIADLP